MTALAFGALGCGPADSAAPKETPWEHPKVGAEGEAMGSAPDLGPGPKPPLSRGVRRMNIDTLQAAMTRVAGTDVYGAPIEWKYNGKNGFSDGAFGKALGRPDFQTSTEESSLSSSLYLKFVGDAARDICMQMAKNDMKRPDPSARALFPKAPVDGTATDAQITQNIRYLTVRFLGLRVAETDPMVPGLRKVYAAGVESVATPGGAELSPAAEGWRGVCVALFESPLFHND
jgi:hypothetical protein